MTHASDVSSRVTTGAEFSNMESWITCTSRFHGEGARTDLIATTGIQKSFEFALSWKQGSENAP